MITVIHTYVLRNYNNPKQTATGQATKNDNKKVIIKICAVFTDCISEINNTQVDNAKDIDVVMPIYNLIKYR